MSQTYNLSAMVIKRLVFALLQLICLQLKGVEQMQLGKAVFSFLLFDKRLRLIVSLRLLGQIGRRLLLNYTDWLADH